MAITLPLTLLGLGLFLYFLFGAATHALPLAAGLAAGFAATALGVSPALALLAAILAFLFAVAAGRFLGLKARDPLARAALVLAFAAPATIAGGTIGLALAEIFGLARFAVIAAPLAGLACGFVAANRLAAPAG